MSSWQKRREEIRERHVGNTDKRVLLVEGTDDVEAYGSLLERRLPGWENHWGIAHAGNKLFILSILAAETDWLGLVDRDDWSDERIDQEQENLPNLCVLPRFCLENYLIDPDELWASLPEKQHAKVGDGLVQLRSKLLVERDKWVRHGVLWSVINPLWSGLRTLGFKERLLDVHNAQDDDFIRNTLNEWHEFLNPDHIFSQFQDLHSEVVGKSETEQLHRWVHGKQFYESVVHPVLNRLLGQVSVATRRTRLFQGLPIPEDLGFLWERLQW